MKLVLLCIAVAAALGLSTLYLDSRAPTGELTTGFGDSIRLVSDRDFSRRVQAGWVDRGDRLFGIAQDSSAPVSPPDIGVATFPPGYGSGSGPISTTLRLSDHELTDLRFTAWVKFSDRWVGNDAGINKVFYVWHHGKPVVAIAAFGSASAPLELQVRLQDIPPGARNLRPNRRAGRIRRGVWHRWDFALKSNTSGAADGSVRWSVDGIEAGFYDDIAFGGLDDSPYWERLSWNPTYGGKGRPVPALQTIAVDHLTVFGQ